MFNLFKLSILCVIIFVLPPIVVKYTGHLKRITILMRIVKATTVGALITWLNTELLLKGGILCFEIQQGILSQDV